MRGKKLSLDPESLGVESFETAKGPAVERGTVMGQAPPCTHALSCMCASGPFQCGGYEFSEYSCDYTLNAYCTWPPATQHTCVD
jgi:hypothetical protein